MVTFSVCLLAHPSSSQCSCPQLLPPPPPSPLFPGARMENRRLTLEGNVKCAWVPAGVLGLVKHPLAKWWPVIAVKRDDTVWWDLLSRRGWVKGQKDMGFQSLLHIPFISLQNAAKVWFDSRKLLRLLWYYFKDPKVSSAPFRLGKNPFLSLITQFVPRLNSIAVFLGIYQCHLVFCSFSAAVPWWLFVTAASCDFLSICFIQAAQTPFSGHWHWRDWSTK